MKSRSLVAFTCAAALATGHAEPEPAPRRREPNVIIILVDDLGVADVSFSARRLNDGYAAIETPELDSLAENNQTAQLTNAFTHALCGPSRAALVTGRLAHNLGNPFPMVEGGSLDIKYKTVGHEFQLRGYSTHFVGKWGIDYPRPSDDVLANPKVTHEVFNGHTPGMGPTERGFDTFYGLYSSGHNHFTKEVVYSGAIDWHRHNRTQKLDYPDVDHEPDEYSTHLFTREAIAVINSWSVSDDDGRRPGFLHLSYTAPHDPLQAPDEYLQSPSCLRMKNWRRRTYCGMVTAIDRGVGEIRRALDSRGLSQNTVILFSTDNGGAPSVGGFNYPYRGQKATIYEGGLRTPAFLHVPAGLGAGVRHNRYSNAMHIADFSPTLLGIADRASGNRDRRGNYEALGVGIDGVDHSEFILYDLNFDEGVDAGDGADDDAARSPPRKSTVLEYNAFFDHAAYLEGEWKLLLGNAGRADRFEEPTGRWFDSAERPRFVTEEAMCDAVDGLGPNWFIYTWAMRFMVDMAFDAFQPASRKGGEVARARSARTVSVVRNNPYGATINITDERLPKADFDKFDPSEIQLYNLRVDPFEDNNVAQENQDRVLDMLDHLIEQVREDPGHHFSVQKFFIEIPMTQLVQAVVVSLLCVVTACALLTCVLCVKPKTAKKQKIM